jgi:hypothetical protein
MPAAAKKATPIKLTRDRVEATKPASAPYEVRDALVPGLRLLVQPSGHRSWLFRYTVGGTYRKLTLGHYPAVSLEAARTAAATARGEVVKGRDPAADKAAARAPGNSAVAAFKDYDRGHLSWGRDYIDHETGDVTPAAKDKDGNIVSPAIGADTASATRSFFLRRVLPVWGTRQAGSITRQDIVALLDTLKAFKDARRKARTRLSHFFGWTMDRNALVTVNPAAGIAAEGSASRERALTDAELRAVWLACDQAGTFGALVRALILTLARRTEVAKMTRDELSDTLWSSQRTKNGRWMDWHRTAQLNAILEPLLAKSNSPFVFEGRHHNRPLGGFSDWKDKLDAILGDSVAPWTLHDLRRTGVSLMQRLSIPFEVREACQNHKIKGVAGTYSRHDYADEKRHAFEALAAEVDRIVSGRKVSNVVPLTTVRAEALALA